MHFQVLIQEKIYSIKKNYEKRKKLQKKSFYKNQFFGRIEDDQNCF